jgi:uncharacterized protein (DUF1501 family)
MPALPDSTEDCGCDDFRSSRRSFLLGAAATVGAGLTTRMVGDVFTQTAYGATGANPNVLVVVSLRGGADGLSMIVPHGDTSYAAARRRTAIPRSSLLEADTMFGLHPAFQPLQQMWRNGTFGAVQSVGLGNPVRSHFAAMEAVEDADPGSVERRGWINRVVGLIGDQQPQQAMALGTPMVPTALYGPSPTLSVLKLSKVVLPGPTDQASVTAHRSAYQSLWGAAPGPLGQGARTALSTTQTLNILASDTSGPDNGAQYPTGDLGKALAETALTIRAGVGARVITVDFGGWDMHTYLGTIDGGAMATRLAELSAALAAFFTDLGLLASTVTVATISEFGRRVGENGTSGLDHGYGNAMLLLGAGVKGGKVHGRWPGLAPELLEAGDLAVRTDYRSVLAEVIGSRFPESDVSQVFPGFAPQTLGAMVPG